ncbi:hypothetical protein J3456_19200 [Sulfitobacter sp. NFXS29]|uniref:hypothetical protein n=1 Tax=Sulfitobacter sp. NFXS29 TaxID=2818438 RepID=UPI0032DF825F
MTAQDDRWRYLHSVIWDALRRRDDIPLDELPEHVQVHLAETGAARPIYNDVVHARAEDVLAALSQTKTEILALGPLFIESRVEIAHVSPRR